MDESRLFSVALLAGAVGCAAGAYAAGWGALWALCGLFVLLLFYNLYFFRDPERKVPPDPRAVVAAADGRIVEIKRVTEPYWIKGETQMVAVFLSIFDVHVQRAPTAGRIEFVKYCPGQFLDARQPEASAQNEHRLVGIREGEFRVVVRQIAGRIARRIVGWRGEGDVLAKGERLGMIRYGSRVELFLPLEVQITAQVGQRVRGGETIIGYRRTT
jgi:phosphatidylserine decarboxylase